MVKPENTTKPFVAPIADGPYSDAAVDVAGALAMANDAWVELVHVVENDDASETKKGAEGPLEAGRSRLSDTEDVDTRVIDADDAVDQILEETRYHDITGIGAPQESRLRRLISGSTTDEVREQAQNTVVIVRHGSNSETSLFSDSVL